MSSLYQPSIEDIEEDKLLELAQIEAEEATQEEKPLQPGMKHSRVQSLRRGSDEGAHSDGEINNGKPPSRSVRKPLYSLKPRRNFSTGNLMESANMSFDKRFLSHRSRSVPDINQSAHRTEKPVISYTIAYDKTKRTLVFSNLKVSDLPVTLTSKNLVYIQCDTIPMDIQRSTETQDISDELHFEDDLVFTEMDESEFSKITILLTVHNVSEAGKKGSVMAEVAFPLSKIHFRDTLPVPMKQNLQTGKRFETGK